MFSRYLLAPIAFFLFTTLPAAAHTDTDIQRVHYQCDVGKPFRVVYEFNHPQPRAYTEIHGKEETLQYENGGFSNARYSLLGEVDRTNAEKTDVFLFEHTREKINGKWQAVDLIVGKNCSPTRRY